MTTLQTASPQRDEGSPIRSLIPARFDRLGWSHFHTMLVVALGVAWVLDAFRHTGRRVFTSQPNAVFERGTLC